MIELPNHVLLLDTPGVLWPKLEDPDAAYRLAASGAIGDAAMDPLDVALFAVGYLLERYPDALAKRYKLDELSAEPQVVLEEIGRRRGCLRKGDGVDLYRASELLLNELRSAKIARISLESP